MVGTKPPSKGVVVADVFKAVSNWGRKLSWGRGSPSSGQKARIFAKMIGPWKFTFVIRPIDRDLHQHGYFEYKEARS